MTLTDAELQERVADRVASRDRKAIQRQVVGLRNLAESMRRDGKWRVSAMSVFEAAWTIEKLLEGLDGPQSERTGA